MEEAVSRGAVHGFGAGSEVGAGSETWSEAEQAAREVDRRRRAAVAADSAADDAELLRMESRAERAEDRKRRAAAAAAAAADADAEGKIEHNRAACTARQRHG